MSNEGKDGDHHHQIHISRHHIQIGRHRIHLGHHHDHQPPPHEQYGTFEGFDSAVGIPDGVYPPQPPPPTTGIFPQPAPPPGNAGYYAHGYQAIPGYAVVVEGDVEGMFLKEPRLPYGIGLGWLLFIIGFFLAAVPWYVGAFVMLFRRVDPREKPGFVACTIAACIAATIAIIIGATKEAHVW